MDIPEKSLESIDIVMRTLRNNLLNVIAKEEKWDIIDLKQKYIIENIDYIEVKEKISRSPKKKS
jgi:hypothetical protein